MQELKHPPQKCDIEGVVGCILHESYTGLYVQLSLLLAIPHTHTNVRPPPKKHPHFCSVPDAGAHLLGDGRQQQQ